MNVRSIIMSGLLITSSFIAVAGNHGVYYSEFKALKEAPVNQLLFNQERSGGSHTNQCNIYAYKSVLYNDRSQAFFAKMDLIRKDLSAGTFQRKIAMGRELSFMRFLLQVGLSDYYNSDLIIVTSETMPALYHYVDSISKKAGVVTPVIFVSLKNDFFKSFSRKILGFAGSVVIGQELLQALSDEELEAVVAQEIGHIKYNHSNKTYAMQVAVLTALVGLIMTDVLFRKNNVNPVALHSEPMSVVGLNLLNNDLVTVLVVPALASLLVSKRFAKQVDAFASKAGKSNGLISFYERLEARDQLRAEEFDAISASLQENATKIPFLLYAGLWINYYIAKAEHCVAGVYNKFAYPSHQARIEAAQKYLQQQA